MIKLKDLLYETTNLSTAGESAGQLWPFAKRATYAKRWEHARMEELFGGCLEGMERVDDKEMAYIASIHDIDDLDDHKPAGMSGDHWHAELPQSVLGEWELVRHMFDMGEVDREASPDPTVESDLLTKTSELRGSKK